MREQYNTMRVKVVVLKKDYRHTLRLNTEIGAVVSVRKRKSPNETSFFLLSISFLHSLPPPYSCLGLCKCHVETRVKQFVLPIQRTKKQQQLGVLVRTVHYYYYYRKPRQNIFLREPHRLPLFMTRIRLFFPEVKWWKQKNFWNNKNAKQSNPQSRRRRRHSRSGPVFYAATAKKPNRDEAFHLE